MARMLQLRASLLDSDPEIWRLLHVDPRLTLAQLHTVLQVAFGWQNCHLHQFHEEDGTRYATPAPREFRFENDNAVDERKVQLAQIFNRPEKRIAYEYDFGDSWIHAIDFEREIDSDTFEYPRETWIEYGRGVFSGKQRAAICVEGARNGPPEDSGGLYGFQELLELRRHPPPRTKKHEWDHERLAWLGDWDPDWFGLDEINQHLGRVRVKKAFAQ